MIFLDLHTMRGLIPFIFIFLFCRSLIFAQSKNEVKDTLFYQYTETKEWIDPEGLRTNLIKVKAQIYAPPRIFVKKDSLYKPTKVRVTLSFEANPNDSREFIPDSSGVAGDFSQTVLKIYQLYINKMRREYYKSSLKKGQTLHLQEIIERNFQDMIETDLKFRDETVNGTIPDKVKSWNVMVKRELDSIEKKE